MELIAAKVLKEETVLFGNRKGFLSLNQGYTSNEMRLRTALDPVHLARDSSILRVEIWHQLDLVGN
jgi:hypothetical protein